MLEVLAREYLSVYSVSVEGALISNLVGRSFTITMSQVPQNLQSSSPNGCFSICGSESRC